MSGPIIPRTFSTAGINTPGAWLDQNYEAIRAWIDARNPTAGPIASRPSPGNVGALYLATDSGNLLYLDDGAAWQLIAVNWNSAWPGASFLDFQTISNPATPAAGSGRLWTGSAGLARPAWTDASGQITVFSGSLFKNVGNPIKDVNTTVTETSLFTTAPTIKGGTLGSDRAIRGRLRYDLLQNTGSSRTVTFKIKYGATTLFTYVLTFGNSSGTRFDGAILDFVLQAIGATNLQQLTAVNSSMVSGNGPTNTTGIVYTAGAEDSTTDLVLDVTAQLSASSANLSIRSFSLIGELIG